MTYLEDLQQVIHKLYGVHSMRVMSVPVTETFNYEVIWDGIVEVFQLRDHARAAHAYA